MTDDPKPTEDRSTEAIEKKWQRTDRILRKWFTGGRQCRDPMSIRLGGV